MSKYTLEIVNENTVRIKENDKTLFSFNKRNSLGNCKLSFIENLGGALMYGDRSAEDGLEIMKLILKECHITVHFNISYEPFVKFLEDNFEIYSIGKAPVGYGNERSNDHFHYHVVLKNTYSKSGNKQYLR